MPGKGSRARRVEATRRAFADVYRLRGAEMPAPPFGNERQDRIYTQQYAKYRRSYWHVERMHAELAEVYGYTPTPRLRHGEREMRHTAEEVRERAAEDMAAHVSADMLLAYADLLEQMESAEPVAEVVATNCSCHPETCCCGDYTLILNDSTVTTGSKAQMRRIADAINTRPQAASADAEDAARWRYLLRNRFVLGNGTCLIDAHRTAQDAELLDAIDEARAEEAE